MMRTMILGLGTAAVAAVLAASTARAPEITPVLDLDFPDPFVLATSEGLAAYAANTRRDGRRINVQMSRSTDGGRAWSRPIDAMPTPPPWARQGDADIWAPEVARIGQRYVLYFSARHATRRRPDGLTLCVGAAVGDRPEGPFTPQTQPLTCDGPHGAIDVSPFRDGDDLWLYIKTDGNCCDTPVRIIAQRLSADGLSLAGEPTTVEGLTNDAPWEGKVIEAPTMVRRGDRYVMLFTANDFGGRDYAMGYAECDGPVGPCRDAAENPILTSRDTDWAVSGPGHQSVVEIAGRQWVAFHGWRTGRDGDPRYRALYLAPLVWNADRPAISWAKRASDR